MIESSQKVIGLCKAERINMVKPVQLCPLTHLHGLITELDESNELLNPYRAAGLTII
ncbi:hypothetical protein [Paraflavitalea speifideaquila]|uniref:hypothetical protein n=1 Tax=Paraflavitalea speifideaquila TaxID=3076558 RepID=UPI0028E1F67B|nr:hypothetical protein [Paraflavitalea speifideiaquila]